MNLDCLILAAMCAAWVVLGATIAAELLAALVELVSLCVDALTPVAGGSRA